MKPSSSSNNAINRLARRLVVGANIPRQRVNGLVFEETLQRRKMSSTPQMTANDSKSQPWSRGRLTQVAHRAIGAVLRPGDFAIDATAGNGYDTVFLANQVDARGLVVAVDIQPKAIQATRARLRTFQCASRVRIIHDCHSQLRRYTHMYNGLPLRAAMFNLGYLPRGSGSNRHDDHDDDDDRRGVITQPETTLAALEFCLNVLSPGGVISIMAYRGHAGGQDETDAIARRVTLLTGEYKVQRHEAHGSGPLLWLIQREDT